MGLVQTAAPVIEPLTKAELKLWVRMDPDDATQDSVLDDVIGAARRYAEQVLDRQLITATWQLTLDCFPWWYGRLDLAAWQDLLAIRLPRPPLQSVTSAVYVDQAGATQTLDPTLYQVDAKGEPGRVMPVYNRAWPVTRPRVLNAVTITYTAGYGSAASSVPLSIKQAVKLLAGWDFANREPAAADMQRVRDLLDSESWGAY